MRKYETIFVLKTVLDDESKNSLIEKFKGIIESDGEVIKVDDWGKKTLSYEIQKLRDGNYVYVEYRANPELIKELERNFRINDDVLRYMTTKLDEKVGD